MGLGASKLRNAPDSTLTPANFGTDGVKFVMTGIVVVLSTCLTASIALHVIDRVLNSPLKSKIPRKFPSAPVISTKKLEADVSAFGESVGLLVSNLEEIRFFELSENDRETILKPLNALLIGGHWYELDQHDSGDKTSKKTNIFNEVLEIISMDSDSKPATPDTIFIRLRPSAELLDCIEMLTKRIARGGWKKVDGDLMFVHPKDGNPTGKSLRRPE